MRNVVSKPGAPNVACWNQTRDTPFMPPLRLPQHQEPRDGLSKRKLDGLPRKIHKLLGLSLAKPGDVPACATCGNAVA